MASEAEAAVCGFRRKRVISTNARGHNNHCKPEKKVSYYYHYLYFLLYLFFDNNGGRRFSKPSQSAFLDLVLVVVQLLQRALKFQKSCDKVESRNTAGWFLRQVIEQDFSSFLPNFLIENLV